MQKEPTTYRDSLGRDWQLSFNLAHVRDIEETLRIDFSKLQGGALITLGQDPAKIASLLWILCERQCDAAKVDERSFAEGLDGQALADAEQALEAAVVNFTRPALRGAVRDGMTAAGRAQEVHAEEVRDYVKSDELTQMMRSEIKRELKGFGKQSRE